MADSISIKSIIDNFDYKLLSGRTLRILGKMSRISPHSIPS